MFDFDTVINRRNSNSLKWDVAEHELPMWVADMDFKTAPAIIEALQNRVNHGVFGYNIVPNEWYDAYISWWQRRHQITFAKDWLIFATGVVPILSSVVRKLTSVAENVLIMTPVYNIFYNSILNNGRNVLECPLTYEHGQYSINWQDFEEKLALPQTSMFILCNPHNPVGKIWDADTLARIGELCAKYAVTVIADEIHCDLTAPNLAYTPFAKVNDLNRNISVTCIAPTKTFNIAGLQTACAVVPNPVLRHRVNRGLNTDEVAEPNSFAITATIAAFMHGEPWLEELRVYLQANKEYCVQQLQPYDVHVVSTDATYLLWLDCSAYTTDSEQFAHNIRQTTGLYVSAGAEYGKGGERFLRLNVACPRAG